MKLRVASLLALSCLALGCLGAARASPASDLFGVVTRTVREDYFGWSTRDFGGLVSEYASKLQAACEPQPLSCSYEVGRTLVSDLLGSYGDPHTSIKGPEAAQRTREVQQDLAVWRTGLRTVSTPQGLLVVSVMPGSPAAQAGMRRFDLITSVGRQAAGSSGREGSSVDAVQLTELERQGGTLDIVYQRLGQSAALSLPTARLKARDIPSLSWVGERKNVALIDLPTFLPADSSSLFLSAVEQAKRARAEALIVDLRYNGGGSLGQCVAAASIFGPVIYNTEFKVGGYSYAGLGGRVGNYAQTLAAPASAKVWTGKAAVLVGPETASCAEVFTFFARQAGVHVIGQPTKGVGNSGVLLSDLPDGSLLSVTILKGYDRLGRPLPAQILPDVAVSPDLAALASTGADTTLQAALGQVKAGRVQALTRPPLPTEK